MNCISKGYPYNAVFPKIIILKSIINRSCIKNMLTIAIALVWLVNGFLCKLLNWVPRHQLIVSRILGEEHAYIATKIIGILEILMSIWILSNIKSRWCAITQIIIVAIMNSIEFFLVPEILLFGRSNAILAAILIVIIFLNEFVLNRANHKRSI